MSDKFKSYIINPLKTKYVFFAIFTTLSIFLGTIFIGFKKFADITEATLYKELSTLHISISLSIIILYIILCTYLKAKRKAVILKGLLMYQLIGVSSFALYFLFRIFGVSDILILPQYLFQWWAYYLRPLSLYISKLAYYHMAFPYVMGLLYVIVTYITVLSLSGLIKNINFEKKIEQQKALEQESYKRHG